MVLRICHILLCFFLEIWQHVMLGRWSAQSAQSAQNDIIWLEGRALMLRYRHKCRAQHARAKFRLALCDDLALTLALASQHHLSLITASSMIFPSLSVGSHKGGTPLTVGRVCTAFRFVTTSSVMPATLVRKPVLSSARHERTLNTVQTARRLRPKASALDHCSLRGITSSGTGALTKRRLVSETPDHSRAETRPKTTRRARSRRAEERRLKFNEAAADASHGLTFLQWTQSVALLAQYMNVLFWRGELASAASLTLAATHHYLPTLPEARHGGAGLAGFRTKSDGSLLTPLPKPVVFAMIGLCIRHNNWEMTAALVVASPAM